ncbi:MAG: Sir2 family NAD-dependent protein deacetylase, partial [Thermovirgaceae bacterium]|nr:Sir2 family NAD-dependent protein deacetylase [Thermovirgaceae bacterium]
MVKNLETTSAECAELIKASRRIVLLSGAGMSTNAGLPDFRGPNGIYKQKLGADPERVFDIDWFRREPSFFYEFHREFLSSLNTIEPTFSHTFFASLEKMGKMSGIVTQNIDALHQRAGSKKVFEMHGSVWKSFCTNCGREWNYEDSVSLAFSCDVPRCDSCSGLIKPDVVFFGEMVKQLEESRDLARSADLFFVVGSSLNVTPAALLPSMTRGAIVVVNKGEISGFHLPRERIQIFAEEDIDTFFR